MRRGLLLVTLALTACGPQPNQLGGSVSELFPLEVSRVEAVQNEEALQLTYLRNRGAELDVVIRVTVALGPEETLGPGTKLALDGASPQGFRRATILHIPGGEPSRDLGAIEKGELKLTGYAGFGELVEGEFSARFVESESLASGRNVFGGFAVTLEDGRIVDP